MKLLYIIYALFIIAASTLYNWGTMDEPRSRSSSGSSWSSGTSGSWGGGGGHK